MFYKLDVVSGNPSASKLIIYEYSSLLKYLKCYGEKKKVKTQ